MAVARAEDLAEEGLDLGGATQDAGIAGEDLHHHHRVQVLGPEDGLCPLEVDVRRLAAQDLVGRPEALLDSLIGHGSGV